MCLRKKVAEGWNENGKNQFFMLWNGKPIIKLHKSSFSENEKKN